MAYLDRITAEAPQDLIAEQVSVFTDLLARRHPTHACVQVSYVQARRNRAHVERRLQELRAVWRKARTGDQSWRVDLVTFVEHDDVDSITRKRFQLIAQYSPRPDGGG